MVENTKIEWCDHTFNPWIGCQKVSPGCDRCYAEKMMDHRYGKVQWGPHGKRKRTSDDYWKQPHRWAKAARESGTRPRVFCASLADVFDNKAPEGARPDLFRLIRATPELDWLLLTKRPQNIVKMRQHAGSGGCFQDLQPRLGKPGFPMLALAASGGIPEFDRGGGDGSEGAGISSDCRGTTPALELLSLTSGSLVFAISRFASDSVV
jgi:Protein of unknown function (DUF5131)